jgi:carbon-monoxide dehydrogenase medium subunit
VYPAPFEYHRPGSVEDAIALLTTYEDDAKLLAGGHSLIPLLKLRFAQPKHLIDVRHIPSLSGVREVDGAIAIGATTTHATLERSALLRQKLPILPEAASQIGDAQVRNMGTIGGSLAHADPSADLPAVMLAVGAEVTAVGPGGARTIRAEDFFVDLLTTVLASDEVLTEIRIPVPAVGTGGAYEKYPHPASRYALVGVAAVVTVAGDAIQGARIAVTGIGSTASRTTEVERALAGRPADAETIAAAASHVADGIDVRGDLTGPAEWRGAVAREYAERAITRAVQRARGEWATGARSA